MIAPRVVLVSDLARVALSELLRRVASAPADVAGAVAVVLRDPDLPGGEKLRVARELRERTRAAGASLVVADRLDVARLVQADGAHLGGRSVDVVDAREYLGPEAWISVACHAAEEVALAARAGADAAVLAPIFDTPGKGRPLGLDALRRARALAPGITLVALGGVDPRVAPRCLAAGADAVAAVRADLVSTLAAGLAT